LLVIVLITKTEKILFKVSSIWLYRY